VDNAWSLVVKKILTTKRLACHQFFGQGAGSAKLPSNEKTITGANTNRDERLIGVTQLCLSRKSN
jgi:hypothetical protein